MNATLLFIGSLFTLHTQYGRFFTSCPLIGWRAAPRCDTRCDWLVVGVSAVLIGCVLFFQFCSPSPRPSLLPPSHGYGLTCTLFCNPQALAICDLSRAGFSTPESSVFSHRNNFTSSHFFGHFRMTEMFVSSSHFLVSEPFRAWILLKLKLKENIRKNFPKILFPISVAWGDLIKIICEKIISGTFIQDKCIGCTRCYIFLEKMAEKHFWKILASEKAITSYLYCTTASHTLQTIRISSSVGCPDSLVRTFLSLLASLPPSPRICSNSNLSGG